MANNIKQATVARYKTNVLIESGTYHGDMVNAQLHNFERIISIELSDRLFKKAMERFKGNSKVTLLHGDSGKLLPAIIQELHEPATFWLDGHFSSGVTARGDKDTPVRDELIAIFGHPLKHKILVDDARHFNGQNDYPTIDEIKGMTDRYIIEVINDIIHIL